MFSDVITFSDDNDGVVTSPIKQEYIKYLKILDFYLTLGRITRVRKELLFQKKNS